MASEELIKYQDDIWSFDNIKSENVFLIFIAVKKGYSKFLLNQGYMLSRTVGGREGNMFYSTLPLPTAHKHSDIYL